MKKNFSSFSHFFFVFLRLELFAFIIGIIGVVFLFSPKANSQSLPVIHIDNPEKLGEFLKQDPFLFSHGVSITDLSIDPSKEIYKRGEKVKLKFSISSSFPTAGIWVELKLAKEDSSSKFPLIERKLFSEPLSLTAESKHQFSVDFKIPPHLPSGKYNLFLNLRPKNSFGVIENSRKIELQINGDNEFLEIKDLKVVKEGEEYTPFYGLTFNKNTPVKIRVRVNNLGDLRIKTIPKFELYEYSFWGDKVLSLKGKQVTANNLEEKTFEFSIDNTNLKPGAYTATLQFFKDKSFSEPVSGIAQFHWLVEGACGKITSFVARFNKESNSIIGNITISKTISDDFPLGNAVLKIELKTERGEVLETKNIPVKGEGSIDLYRFKFDGDSLKEITPESFVLVASLIKDGTVLSQYIYKPPHLVLQEIKKNKYQTTQFWEAIAGGIIVLILAIILVVSISKRFENK